MKPRHFKTLGDVYYETQRDTLAETLAKVETEKPGDTPPESVVHTLADTLAKIKSDKLGDTLNDVNPKPLDETLPLRTVGVALIDVQVKIVIDKLVYKLREEKAETVGDTRCHVETRLWSTTWLRRQQK